MHQGNLQTSSKNAPMGCDASQFVCRTRLQRFDVFRIHECQISPGPSLRVFPARMDEDEEYEHTEKL